MAMYGCIYFDGDKSLSVVSKSRCVLRQNFEEGCEVEVSWKGKKGAKEIWLGVIVKIASKEKKAALEKFADSLNKIITEHVENSPTTSPREILLQHGRSCELDKYDGYGDENQQPNAGKRKPTSTVEPAKATKRKNTNPLLEKNKQSKKKKAEAQGASSLAAGQEMMSLVTMSPSFTRSFPSKTHTVSQNQFEPRSEVNTPLVVTGLQASPNQQSNVGQKDNAFTENPTAARSEENSPLVYTDLQTPQNQRSNIGQKDSAFSENRTAARSEANTPLVVAGLQVPPNKRSSVWQQNNAFTRNQTAARSEYNSPLVVTGLQTPPNQRSNVGEQKDNAFTGNQAAARSEDNSPLVVTGLQTPPNQRSNVGEQKDNAFTGNQAAARSELRHTSQVGTGLQTPQTVQKCSLQLPTRTKRPLQQSPGFSSGETRTRISTSSETGYEVWRSSMTALLNMDSDEFDKEMLNPMSESDKTGDLYKEIEALREENQSLKDQLRDITTRNGCTHPVPTEEVINFLECFVTHYHRGDHELSRQDLHPAKQFRIRANLSPSVNNTSPEMVKLLENYEVFVDRQKLRAALQGATKKNPIYLLNKLIPLVFSEEDLANSCGLGIHSSASTSSTSTKLPLDAYKVGACKEYLTAFCIQRDLTYPSSKEVNSAFTQQITYARVKLSRRSKLVDLTAGQEQKKG